MSAEFRQDVVMGHWVLIAPGRVRRPSAPEADKNKPAVPHQPKENCPFENPQASGHDPHLVYNKGKPVRAGRDFKGPWTVQVVGNKFPAVSPGACPPARSTGPFSVINAHGVHEVVITRDHERDFHELTQDELAEVLTVYRERYRQIATDRCSKYISIFHNHGRTAGGSLYHPHSQIISTPVLPSEVLESLNGAERYWRKHGQKVHDMLIEWEVGQGKRIVYENEKFIVFCPFVSKTPYELRIFPKLSQGHFEETADADLPFAAQALSVTLRKMYNGLDNPDFNFFIHTSPNTAHPQASHSFYHWHIEIVPRLSIAAGFELGTSIYINPVDPDVAADVLRAAKA